MLQKRLIVIFIIFTLLITLASCQRGGGRSRGGRSRSRSSGIRGSSSRSSLPLTEGQKRALAKQRQMSLVKNNARSVQEWLYGKQIDIAFNEHYYQHQVYYEFGFILSIIGIFISIVTFFSYISNMKDFWKFQSNVKAIPCTKDQKQCEKIAKQFVSGSWQMLVKFKDEFLFEPFYFSLFSLSKKKWSSFKYEFFGKGQDEVGQSRFKGFLLFNGEGMALYFEKDYLNQRKAGQTGSFRHLVYQGFTKDYKNWTGTWAFKGHENEGKYSGTWTIEEQTTETQEHMAP